tara:strand:- start:140 stop:391 length:252 start_codon:yes stop_codon:yes gene_type:complete
MLSMQNAIRKTRFVTINKVMDKFMNERISNTSGMFNPCPRDICYCYDLIMRPEKTKITSNLIMNAEKCKKEYFMMQDIIANYD